jgi:DNA-binding CsgD family transcriptional regulator
MNARRRRSDGDTIKHWALSAMDHLRFGVFVLDASGQAVYLNPAAQRLTGASGHFGLRVERHGLTLPAAADTLSLRNLIAIAAAAHAHQPAAPAGSLQVPALNGTASLLLRVLPLPQDKSDPHWDQHFGGGCVAVFATTSAVPSLSQKRMMELHGFTRAEAKLSKLLAAGSSLDEAASAMALTTGTVRSQLKSIFSKTGVTRQGELVALLLADMASDHADHSP